MREKEFVIRLRLPKTPRKRWLLASIVGVIGFSAVVYATVPNVFNSGDPLTHTAINANFTNLDGRTTTLEGNSWSGNATTRYFNGGNVGIGTSAPAAPLHVAAISAEGVRLQGSAVGAASESFITFFDSAGTRIGFVGDAATADSNVFLASDSGSVQLVTSGGRVLTATPGGRVGVATSAPSNTLGVTGTIGASGAITANTTPDLAETISAAADVGTADVVCADRRHKERVVRCGEPDAGPVLGVISDGTSSFLINSHGGYENAPLTGKPLVLAGRVPVKVSAQSGPIAIGDLLAPATIRGVATRATEAGPVIGVALEPFDGISRRTGQILCFVKVGEGNVAQAMTRLQRENATLRNENRLVVERLERLENAIKHLASMKAGLSFNPLAQQ